MSIKGFFLLSGSSRLKAQDDRGLSFFNFFKQIFKILCHPERSVRIQILNTLLIFIFTLFPFSLNAWKKPITVMLNPAGDAQRAGRQPDGMVERALTAQCCDHLKKALEATYTGLSVVLTRIPGDTVAPLQNASFANRLGADLYISIHFFEKKQGRPQLFFYHFSLNPVTDGWSIRSKNLAFVPYHKAYIEYLPLTKHVAEKMSSQLETEHLQAFDTHKPISLPFAPLLGIKSPALGIEMSLKNNTDWRLYIPALVDAIGVGIDIIRKKRGRLHV